MCILTRIIHLNWFPLLKNQPIPSCSLDKMLYFYTSYLGVP